MKGSWCSRRLGELFCPCLWGRLTRMQERGWLLSPWYRLQPTSSTPKFANSQRLSLTEPSWRWNNWNSTSLRIFVVLTQICFSRFMVKHPHGAQTRLELLSASLIPWLFFFQSSLQVILFQCSKGWKSKLKQLLINSCISKLHRAIISQRCKDKMILHRVNYFPIWNTKPLSNSFKTLIVVEHPVCSINYSQSQLENHCY